MAGTAVVALPLLQTSNARAQTYIWGGPGSTTSSSTYELGTNWSASPAGAPPVTSTKNALFSWTGSAAIVVGSGGITAGRWQFDTTAQDYAISGGDVTLQHDLTQSGGSNTIANNVTASDLKVSGGQLTLSGSNTFSSTVDISGGMLKAGSAGALGNAGFVMSGGTLDLGGFDASMRQLSGSGTITNSGAAAATLSVNQNVSAAFLGVISDGISMIGLTKSGSNTLLLGGQNTYSGTTRIEGGILQAGAANAFSANSAITLANTAGATLNLGGFNQTIGSLAGGGANGGEVQLTRASLTTGGDNTSTTFAGEISGTGGLTKTGSGTFTLTGGSTYTGPTRIDGGVLSIGSGGYLSSATIARLANTAGVALKLTGQQRLAGLLGGGANGGNVELDNARLDLGANNSSSSFAGAITGTGYSSIASSDAIALVKSGTATLTLSGANTYSGITYVFGGSLSAGAANTFSRNSDFALYNNGSLDLNGYDQTIGSLTENGPNSVTLGAATLTISRGGIHRGNMTGTGGLTIGGGYFVMTGTNAYTGATKVEGGTLRVEGSIAASSLTTVEAGATLRGSGTLGNTMIVGGTLAPGISIGALNIQGNLAFNSAARYMVEVSPTDADRVNVTGAATLGGAGVNVSFATGSYVAKEYTILTAGGGISGKFGAQVNTDLPASFKSALRYDGNTVYLDLALDFTPTPPDPTPPGPIPPPPAPSYPALNSNQRNVANTLVNYFNATGGIPLAFGALTSTGLTQASGEISTGLQQASINAMTQFIGVMTDPFTAGRGDDASTLGYAATSKPTDAFASINHGASPTFRNRWNAWAAGFGGSQTTDGHGITGFNTARSSIYGTAVGADYWFSPQTVAGFAMAGGGTSFSVINGGTGRSDLMQTGAFVRHTIGNAYVTAAAAYGWQAITTDRSVTAGVTELRGSLQANTYAGRIEGGQRYMMDGFGLTPYAAAQVTAFDLPSYAETSAGGLFALTYADKTMADTRSELGLRSDKSFAVNDALLTLRGRAAWAHNYSIDRTVQASFQTLPGTSFVVNGATAARHTALTSASAEVTFMSGLSLAATFDGEFSDTTRSYAGKGVVRYAW